MNEIGARVAVQGKVVEHIGRDEALRPGDAVLAFTNFNAYAEWAAVARDQVHKLPAGMSFDDGAAISVTYLTAYHSLFTMGNLQPGDRVYAGDRVVEVLLGGATFDLSAPVTGRLAEKLALDDDVLRPGQIVGYIEEEE